MKIAHIIPTKFLGSMLSRHDYFLALAHLITEDSEYADWHAAASKKGHYVMLDNGVEEGEKIDILTLLEAAERIGASELVLPDVFRDGDATIASTSLALEDAKIQEAASKGLKLAAVVHGKDRTSWLNCFDIFNSDARINTVMIPKVLDDVWGYGGRFAACAYLQASGRTPVAGKEYHLLGVWTDPLEVYMHSVYNKWVRGLDTSLGFQAGYQEVSLSYLTREGGHKPKRPQAYFSIDTLTAMQSTLIKGNMALLDGWGNSHGRKL